MPSPSWALQQAIFAKLASDAALLALLGGVPRIYDDVPQGADFPYLTFASSQVRDLGASPEDGTEHILSLNVWSLAKGRKETHEIMGALRAALHDQTLSLASCRLVNLRCDQSEARRESDGETYRGTVRLRAVTEPIP
jgi:hypothetical protein